MFHPDLRLLRSFGAVAAELSVTRAAERLHLTQPTVSGQIKELERALGFPLFHRTTRSVALSLQGARLLPFVQGVLAESERLRDEVEAMQSAGQTRFRLGAAMYTLDIPERVALLEDFAAAHPAIGYLIDNRLQSAQLPDLLGERLDASLMLGIGVETCDPADPIDDHVIVNETQYPDTLERVLLQRRPMHLLVPRDAPLAAHERLSRDQLKGERIAMLSREHGRAFIDPIETFLCDCGAEPVTLAEGNAFAVERYAERHGICALGLSWFTPLPTMVARDVEGMAFHLDFAVVLGTGANRAARRFFEFAKDWRAAREKVALAA